MAIIAAIIATFILLWLVLAAPVGAVNARITRRFSASPSEVWHAVYPFGFSYLWNNAASAVHRTGSDRGRIITTHAGRDDRPIEREFVFDQFIAGENFKLRYTSDSSLADSFFANYSLAANIEQDDNGDAVLTVTERDHYRGIAFLVFRYFALRRYMNKLEKWLGTGEFKKGGVFEHPATQLGMAVISALALWPLFGLDQNGLFLSIALTVVVGLHELGHMLAFRLMGHTSARMIFIPLLGGMALGGRPYDRHFEVGLSALMGAGFSTFILLASMFAAVSMAPVLGADLMFNLLIFILILALFNVANLVPVWKFDGGQVLRQIFRTPLALGIASAIVLAWFVVLGLLLGVDVRLMVVICIGFLLLSIMTSQSGVKPKRPLVPMNALEKVALATAFGAVFAAHGLATVWSARMLFT